MHYRSPLPHLHLPSALGPAGHKLWWCWNAVWEAVTSGLIHKVPGEYAGIVTIQAAVQRVASADHSCHVILELLTACGISVEGIWRAWVSQDPMRE